MYVIADERSRGKFEREVEKRPFLKIKDEYIFKTYIELDAFFESVKDFVYIQNGFLNE